jgi:hypothetical protein
MQTPHRSEPRTGFTLLALALAMMAIVVLGLPSPARASGAEPVADGSMILLLTILGAIGAAYLVAHFLMGRIQRRMLVTSGIEYVLLGILLGSSSGVLSDHLMLEPVLAFGTGWVGLLEGAAFRVTGDRPLPKHALRLAAVDLVVVGGGVGLVGFAVLFYGLDIDVNEAIVAGTVLGCAATSGSPSSTRLLGQRFTQLVSPENPDQPRPGTVYELVATTSRLTQALAILAFGVVTCVFHAEMPGSNHPPVAAEWLLLMLGLGLALGGLFRLLVSNESTENQRFMAMVGIICFSTGAAFFLDLSALTVNLVLGAVLVLGAGGDELRVSLAHTMAPVVLLLLLVAGVIWTPIPLAGGTGIVLAVVLARFVFKLGSGALAAAGTPLRPDIGRGFFAQGVVGLCIALSYRLIFRGEAVEMVYTAILVSVVVSEAVAPRALRGLLVDAGELRQDMAMTETPTQSAS